MLKAVSKSIFGSGFPPRPPRDDIECRATLCTGEVFLRVQLCDVSRNGCKILVETPQVAGERVQIALEAFHSLGGTIRWYRKGKAGIQFIRPMSDTDLATWTNALARARVHGRNRGDIRRNFWGEPVRGSNPR
jgi:hypothetical protein